MITFDGLFLGRLGPDALAGVSLAFPFVMLIQHTAASGMGGGVSSAIARALGAGKRDVADALALHTFVLALGLAAAFSTVLLLGAPYIFRWMGGHGEMLSAALAYANVAFSGAVSICMLNLLGSAVRGTGNMGLPSGVIVGSVIAHVLISPLLIFGWGPVPALGPAGAGWGLMMSFGAGSLVLIGHLRSSRSLVTLRFRGVSLQWGLFAEVLQVVGPIYGLYGLGMALYFAAQGFGSVMWTVTANAVRLLVSAGCALIAITWLELGAIGFFVAIAGGFCAYAALTAAVLYSVKEPS